LQNSHRLCSSLDESIEKTNLDPRSSHMKKKYNKIFIKNPKNHIFYYHFNFGNNKIIFEDVEFFQNYLFEMSQFEKITRESKIQKLVETQEPLASGQCTCRASIQLSYLYFSIV
jgi:hypothetical protein